MKKVVGGFMVAVLVMCNSVVALAATSSKTSTYNGTWSNGNSQDATVTFQKASETNVVSVNISWGAMQFTYDGKVVWDTSLGEYYKATGTVDTWSPVSSSNTVTITNNSEVGVYADISYGADTSKVKNVTGSVSPSRLELGSKAKDQDAIITGTSTVTLSGVPHEIRVSNLSDIVVGNVTVTLGVPK